MVDEILKKIDPQDIPKIKEALVKEIKYRLKEDRVFFYAESLRKPWSDIYAGKLENPTLKDILEEPGQWVKTPIPGLIKPFAHKYQREMTYPFENEKFDAFLKAFIYFYFAGNRGGKTVSLANIAGMLCLGIHPLQEDGIRGMPPLHGWIVSPNLPADTDIPQGEDIPILKTLFEWLPRLVNSGKGIKRFYRKDKILIIVDGKGNESVINFKSYDQDKSKFKSEKLDFVLFDEEPPKHIWEECQLRVMDKKGIIFCAMTPDYSSSWTYKLRQSARENPAIYISGYSGAQENPFLDPEVVRQILENLPPEERLLRAKGQHIQFLGKVFPFEYEKHVGIPFEVTNSNINYVIIDWHPVKPIVISYLSINPKDIWFVWDESVVNEHSDDAVAQEIWSKLSLNGIKIRVKKFIIDRLAKIKQIQENGRRARDIIEMLREHGIRCEVGNPDFHSAHAFLIRKLNLRELYFHPDCKLHIEQFDTWGAKRYMRGNLEGNLRDMLEVEGNDTCINLVMAYNAGAKFITDEFENMPYIWRPRSTTSIIYGVK